MLNENDGIIASSAVQTKENQDNWNSEQTIPYSRFKKEIDRRKDLERKIADLETKFANSTATAQDVEWQIRPILWGSTENFLELLFNDNDWIEIDVIPGTMLPDDKVTEAEQAMELAKLNRISNKLLYERLWIANPSKEAEDFALEQTINAIKAQKLQAQARQEQQATQQAQAWQQQEQQTVQNEVQDISKQIDNLG